MQTKLYQYKHYKRGGIVKYKIDKYERDENKMSKH